MTRATTFALSFCVITASFISFSNSAPSPQANFLLPQWQWQQQPRYPLPLVPIDRNLQNVWFPLQKQEIQPLPQPAFDRPLTIRDCEVKCVCPYNLQELCGSNGLTYGNACQLECQRSCYPGLRVFKEGPCD